MKLIIGLGNPEEKYFQTRHNAGFLLMNFFHQNINNFSPWKFEKKLEAEISTNKELDLIIAKPQTYMNKSGGAVQKITSYFKIPITDLIIAHDDFDVSLGDYKLQKDITSAGHKGVQSIINTLKTQDFWRLRIGIRPKILDRKTKADLSAEASAKAEDFVLKKFTSDELKIINDILPLITNRVTSFLRKDAI